PSIGLTSAGAVLYGELKSRYQEHTGASSRKMKTSTVDFILASLALEHDAVLVSDDRIFRTIQEFLPRCGFRTGCRTKCRRRTARVKPRHTLPSPSPPNRSSPGPSGPRRSLWLCPVPAGEGCVLRERRSFAEGSWYRRAIRIWCRHGYLARPSDQACVPSSRRRGSLAGHRYPSAHRQPVAGKSARPPWDLSVRYS